MSKRFQRRWGNVEDDANMNTEEGAHDRGHQDIYRGREGGGRWSERRGGCLTLSKTSTRSQQEADMGEGKREGGSKQSVTSPQFLLTVGAKICCPFQQTQW